MEASVAPSPAVRGALSHLIDYAGLFPPARLALADAWAEYRRAQATPQAWILGRFIIPASQLAALPQPLEGPLSVIVDGVGLDRIATLRATGARVEALEFPPAQDTATFVDATLAAAAGLRELPMYFEIPRAQWRELPAAMRALARTRRGAKLRCGGVTAAAFPSVEEVVEFILAATTERVPYKATAGLHHPVRHVDAATGFTMHGFLNLLTAAAIAPRADRAVLEAIVAEEDPAAFRFDEEALAWRDQQIDTPELAAARESAFVAYGSCSFAEPVDDLVALRILGAP